MCNLNPFALSDKIDSMFTDNIATTNDGKTDVIIAAHARLTMAVEHGMDRQIFFAPCGGGLTKGDGCAVVESTKAASDVYAPLTGVITAINQDIVDNPALVNESAQDKAWFFKIEISSDTDMDGLMNSDEYSALIA